MMTESDAEAVTLVCIQHALDDAWPDGKRRSRLKRVMQDRIDRVRRTGFQTVEALRLGDYALYGRFIAGCLRAMVRDQLIESGQLGPEELRRLRDRLETRELHQAFDDPTERARYGT